MLKRLSPFHTGDGPPPAQYTSRSGINTPSLAASPSGYSPSQSYFPAQPPPPPLHNRGSFTSNGGQSPAPILQEAGKVLDRAGLQRSLLAMENLLQTLDEYRELNTRMAKAQKRLAKASKELAAGLPVSPQDRPDAIARALQASGVLFEALSEVDARANKGVMLQYDALNEVAGKAFKKISKEEREHEEQLETLNAKIFRANAAYEKHVRSLAGNATGAAKRPGRLSIDTHEATAAHEKHINSVSGPTRDISLAKANHGALMALRRDALAREAALTMTALAESEWRRACEATKRAGVEIGTVVELANFCHAGMPPLSPDEPLRPAVRPSATSSRSATSSPVEGEPARRLPERASRSSSDDATPVPSTVTQRQVSRPLPMPNGPQYASPALTSSDSPSPEKRGIGARPMSMPPTPSERSVETTPKARRSASPPEIVSPSPRSSRIMSAVASLDAVISASSTPMTTPALSQGASGSDSSGSGQTSKETSPQVSRTRHDSEKQRALGSGRPLPRGFAYEEELEASKRAAAVQRNVSIESTDSSRSFVARMKERYAEERAAKQVMQSPPLPAASTRPASSLDGRVADMASRYTRRLTSDPATTGTTETHDDMCACQGCSTTKYRSSRRSSGEVRAR